MIVVNFVSDTQIAEALVVSITKILSKVNHERQKIYLLEKVTKHILQINYRLKGLESSLKLIWNPNGQKSS